MSAVIINFLFAGKYFQKISPRFAGNLQKTKPNNQKDK